MTNDIDPRLTTVRLTGTGVQLDAMVGGPDDGPLVLLLHGFPDAWWTWRGQIRPLLSAGYRVVAPTMRGYGGSDKPVGLDAYRLDVLAEDVLAIVDDLGYETFRLVGHDWGGVVAWETAIRAPARVERLVVLDAPHPDVMRQVVRNNPSQILRSWYVLLFQLPRLPEAILRRHTFAALRRSLSSSSAPGTFSDDDLARLVASWAKPGALTAMLAYYRALPRKPWRDPARVTSRTLVVWGGRDLFLSRAAFDASLAMCDDGAGLWVEEASHWVQLEQPERVVDAILRCFRETDAS